jgi:hypothetical protein
VNSIPVRRVGAESTTGGNGGSGRVSLGSWGFCQWWIRETYVPLAAMYSVCKTAGANTSIPLPFLFFLFPTLCEAPVVSPQENV